MLKNRALSTALLAALACAAVPGTAYAASARADSPAARAASPGGALRTIDARSTPAKGPDLSLLTRTLEQRRQHARGGARARNTRSTNWAGYGVTGGKFTSVSANWVEPSVTCTSNGIVGFWIGLDGWGSTTVEQDGTGVDCQNGKPQQFAWWETYPANSIQVYSAPVSAGDKMSSSITYQGDGKYLMVLTNWTARWTARNPVSLPEGRNASAEIVAEAVTADNDITALPDFGSIGFTDATINGGTLRAAGAQPLDMTDLADNLIAATTTADASGDFAINYAGSTSTSAFVSGKR